MQKSRGLDDLQNRQHVERGEDKVGGAGDQHEKEIELARPGCAGQMARQVDVIEQNQRDGINHRADEADHGGNQDQRAGFVESAR